MTVKQLINVLNSIEDKDITVFAKVFDKYQDRIVEVKEIHDGELKYILMS